MDKMILSILIMMLAPMSSFADIGVQASFGRFEYKQNKVQWDSEFGALTGDSVSYDSSPALRLVQRFDNGIELSAGLRSAGADVYAKLGDAALSELDIVNANIVAAKKSIAEIESGVLSASKADYEKIIADSESRISTIYAAHKRAVSAEDLSLQAMYFRPYRKAKVGAGVEYFKSDAEASTVAKFAVKFPKTSLNAVGAGFEVYGNSDFKGASVTVDF